MRAVVLAGGSGTRLWPVSGPDRPKPFVPLPDGTTLLGRTLARLAGLPGLRETAVLVPAALEPLARRALAGRRGVRLLVEPAPRNTAAAVCLAAADAAARDPDAALLVVPADHHVRGAPAYRAALRRAARAAARAPAVLVGIAPRGPDPAYGYVLVGPPRGGVRPVRGFVEKPDARRAARLLARGAALWNAGIVVARPRALLELARAAAPELWRRIGPALEAIAAGRPPSARALAARWAAAPAVSFDVAVLERARGLLAVEGRFGWSDVGSFEAAAALLPRRGALRAHGAEVVSVASGRAIVWTEGLRRVALVGVDGIVVAERGGELLVCRTAAAQRVREAAERALRGAARRGA